MKFAIYLFVALVAFAPLARASDAPVRQQWEYAKLTFSYRDMLLPYYWETAKADIREVNDRQLVQQLKGLDKEPAPKQYYLFDVIGEAGWELVGISSTSAGVTYVFKRPKTP